MLVQSNARKKPLACCQEEGLPSCERCCVLGTLGSGFTAGAASFAFLLRFSPVDFASPVLALSDEGTDGLAEKSLDPLSGLDGLDEDARLWCPLRLKHRAWVAVARGTDEARVETIGDEGAAATTRRTDEGSIVPMLLVSFSHCREVPEGLEKSGWSVSEDQRRQ